MVHNAGMYFYYWHNAHISKLLHNDTLKILFTFAALRSLNYLRMQIDDQLFKFSLFCTCKFPAEELEGVRELEEARYSTLKRFYLHDPSSKKKKKEFQHSFSRSIFFFSSSTLFPLLSFPNIASIFITTIGSLKEVPFSQEKSKKKKRASNR